MLSKRTYNNSCNPSGVSKILKVSNTNSFVTIVVHLHLVHMTPHGKLVCFAAVCFANSLYMCYLN